VKLRLVNEPASCLGEYGLVAIAFDVTERLDVVPVERGLGGASSQPRSVEPPYRKDYDRVPGHRPAEWADRWDLSKWWFAAAFLDRRRVGGAALVIDTSEIEGAAAEAGVALLWDIRVHPDCRHRGVGRRLLAFAEDHARATGMRRMKVETQNINVAACRFYAAAGYGLAGIDRFAYPDLPDEVQFIWQKDLE
jgi:GNAT superfamily N-acetyltransferase